MKAEVYSYKASCTLYFPHCMLDFDHISHKTEEVSDMIVNLRSRKRIWAEIALTQLLCKNCHAITTFNRGYRAPYSGNQKRPARDFVKSLKELTACVELGKT